MSDISEAKVTITLTIGELKELVALMNLGAESLIGKGPEPEIVAEVSGLYFELMESLRQDGIFTRFQPE